MEADNILDRLHASVLNLLTPLGQEELYKVIVNQAMKLTSSEDGLIVRQIDNELKTVYGSSKTAAAYKVSRRGNSFKALTTDTAIILDAENIKKNPSKNLPKSVKSILFVPLSYHGVAEGVLIVRSTKEKFFSENEVNIMKLFGSMASLAIKRAEAYEETKQALETRDMFISIASHELRTPLTSLNGYVQLLHSRLSKSDTVEAQWVNSLSDETIRLTNLIKELLEINRIKQGTLQFILRECHLADVVQKAIERTKFRFKNREIVFTTRVKETDDIFIGDFDKMLQVVTALLSNALKFSPANSPVTVKLSKTLSTLTLSISDKGKGMGREDIRRVFQGFYKEAENLHSGMGVGLMLAKHIISYHKGTMDIKSELKKGTVIEIKLPRSSL